MLIHPPLLFIGDGKKELSHSGVDWGIQIFAGWQTAQMKMGKMGEWELRSNLPSLLL